MLPLLIALCAGAIALLASAQWLISKRASRARRELAESIHDHALALDLRCDHLQEQCDDIEHRLRVAVLFDLIAHADECGALAAGSPQRLRAYALDLLEGS